MVHQGGVRKQGRARHLLGQGAPKNSVKQQKKVLVAELIVTRKHHKR